MREPFNKKMYNHGYDNRTKYNSSLNEYSICDHHVITDLNLSHVHVHDKPSTFNIAVKSCHLLNGMLLVFAFSDIS